MFAGSFFSGIVQGTGEAIGVAIVAVLLIAIASGFGLSKDAFLEQVGKRVSGLFLRKKASAEVQWRIPRWVRPAIWLFVTGLSAYLAWQTIRSPIEREAARLPMSPAGLSGGAVWNSEGKLAVIPPEKPPAVVTPDVFPPFVGLYRANERELGKPLDIARESPYAHQAVYEKATAIWFDPFNEVSVLYANGSPMAQYPINHKPPALKDIEIRQLLRLPAEVEVVPHGPLLVLWKMSPNEWGRRMGTGYFYCTHLNAEIKYQEFAHGKISGPWRFSKDDPRGWLYVTFNDRKTWAARYAPPDFLQSQCHEGFLN